MEKTFFLSLVIAVYNEGEGLYKLVERIQSSLKEYEGNYEVILIDDRSPDNSWEILCELAAQHEELKIVRFIRNFGQHPALSAGMKLARGEYVVLMDCDLQDEPENIIPMYEKMKAEGKYIIYAKRKRRKDPFRKRFTSKLYNKLLSILSGMEVDPEIGTFRLMHKVVVDSFNKLPENRRYVGGLFYWLGFDYTTMEVEHKERAFGHSNYNFMRMIKLARLGILSFSTRILATGVYLGAICAFISICFGIFYIFQNLIFSIPVPGYTSLIVSQFFIGGIIMLILGIIGEYIGELFHEVKGRPNYIIEEIKNY